MIYQDLSRTVIGSTFSDEEITFFAIEIAMDRVLVETNPELCFVSDDVNGVRPALK